MTQAPEPAGPSPVELRDGIRPSPPFQGMRDRDFKLEGLQEALARLWLARASLNDPNVAARAIFEALNWLHAFQDRQLDVLAPTKADRTLLLALCGARAAFHHHAFDPLDWREAGLHFPLTDSAFPMVTGPGGGFVDFWWRPGIPEIKRRDQRDAYEGRLAGRLVRHAFVELDDMLRRSRHG